MLVHLSSSIDLRPSFVAPFSSPHIMECQTSQDRLSVFVLLQSILARSRLHLISSDAAEMCYFQLSSHSPFCAHIVFKPPTNHLLLSIQPIQPIPSCGCHTSCGSSSPPNRDSVDGEERRDQGEKWVGESRVPVLKRARPLTFHPVTV